MRSGKLLIGISFFNQLPLLPQKVLSKEKKYIEGKLDKLVGYDYVVLSTADLPQDEGTNGFDILAIKLFKGKCSVVDDKILNYDDKNIHLEAFPEPPCEEATKR